MHTKSSSTSCVSYFADQLELRRRSTRRHFPKQTPVHRRPSVCSPVAFSASAVVALAPQTYLTAWSMVATIIQTSEKASVVSARADGIIVWSPHKSQRPILGPPLPSENPAGPRSHNQQAKKVHSRPCSRRAPAETLIQYCPTKPVPCDRIAHHKTRYDDDHC